jgi:TolB-like protein
MKNRTSYAAFGIRLAVVFIIAAVHRLQAAESAAAAGKPAAPAVTKLVKSSGNLLNPDAWVSWENGFRRERETFLCDNGADTQVERGTGQLITLNQTRPEPFFATAYSKAEGATGKQDLDYSLYLDVHYADGTFLWGQCAFFSTGTHDWERREVYVMPEKPVQSVSFYLLFRRHGGKAWFRLPEFYLVRKPDGGAKVATNGPSPVELVAPGQLSDNSPVATARIGEEKAVSIAVLRFDDKGPSLELAVLRTAMAEMLVSDLSQYQGISLVERARAEQLLTERNLRQSLAEPATAAAVGKTLAAEYLLFGSFAARPEEIAVEALLVKTGDPKPIMVWNESTAVSHLPDLEQRLLGKILVKLGIDKPIRRAPPQPRPGPSPSVAVLALRNLGPLARLAPMETGFAEMLQANLTALKGIRLVEREKLHAVLKEQKLSLAGLADPQTAVKVGRLLGAERLVLGAFLELGDSLRLDLRLVDTQTTAIVSAETARGMTQDFASLLEDLALRLAADLAVAAPDNAAELVRAATPVRKLEAAIYFAEGDRLFHLARYVDAAAAYERVLLVEPDNPHVSVRRMRAWHFQNDFAKAIEAGEQALGKGLIPVQDDAQAMFFFWLRESYWKAERYDEYIALCRKVKADFPNAPFAQRIDSGLSFALLYARRRSEGIARLEQRVRDEKTRGNAESYASAMQALHWYYAREIDFIRSSADYRSHRGDPQYRKAISELTKENARRVSELHLLLLKEAEGKRDGAWRYWAQHALLDIDPHWEDEWGQPHHYLTEAELEQRLVEALRVFSWVPKAALWGHEKLAFCRIKQGKWEQAIEPLRYVAEQSQANPAGPLPDSWDQRYIARNSDLDQKIAMAAKIAEIYEKHLNRPDEASPEYARLITEFGVAQFKAPEAALALQACGKDLPRLGRAALVWGGGDAAVVAWSELLGPQGFQVHRAAQRNLTAAQLAPYAMLILVRPGMIPYLPDEILAVRSYVACGGSLLVVVSPGWEPAQPGIVDSLLAPFGLSTGREMVERAESTRIVPHPITHGVANAMAKNPVNLKVPAAAALIQAGDRTVLAAMPYGQGRIVVASLGQWFLPNPNMTVDQYHWDGRHWTSQLAREKLPLEAGDGLQLPLLKNVIAWLAEPHRDGKPSAPRSQIVDAQFAALKAQFGVAPFQTETDAMQRLIADSEPGSWTEESLWAAGEGSLQLVFRSSGASSDANMYWPRNAPFPAPGPHYYERLVEQFPESPLRPYAQWRLAECHRCRAVMQEKSESSPAAEQAPIISWYEKVQASQGSYPWAWTQLRLGMLRFRAGEFVAARPHFQAVADRMPNGPEKSLAVLNAAACALAIGDKAEARRYYQVALSMPNISWGYISVSPYATWCPLRVSRPSFDMGTTHEIAGNALRLNTD